MGELGLEGCDGLSSAAQVLEDPRWLNVSGGGTGANLTGGRFGGGHFRIAGNGNIRRQIVGMSGNVFVTRFSHRLPSGFSGANQNIVTLLNNSGIDQVVRLQFGPDALGGIQLRDANDVVVGGSPTGVGAIQLNQWQPIELRCTVDGAVGACEVWVDDTKVIDIAAGEDFSNGSTDVDVVRYDDTEEPLLDEFIWADCSAGLGSSFIGDKRVFTRVVNADGTYTAWTRNGEAGSDFENIDDPLSAADDRDATYLSATGGSDLAFTAGFDDIPADTTGIVLVAIKHVVRKDDGGTLVGLVKPRMRHSTNDLDGAAFVLGTDWRRLTQPSENVPGGAGWTAAQVNALQGGLFYDVP